MPENEFEKQVQQIFGEMRLKPSEAVWSKVQERVSRDKKRRRILVWLPAALLLLGGGMYWTLSTNTSLQKNNQESEVVANADNKAGAAGSNSASPQAADLEKNSKAATSQTPRASNLQEQNSENESAERSVDANTDQTQLPVTAAGKQSSNKNKNATADSFNNEPGAVVNAKPGKNTAGVKNKSTNSKSSDKNASPGDFNSDNENPIDKQENSTAGNTINESATPVSGTYQFVDGYEGLKNVDGEKELNKFDAKSNKPVIKLAKRKSWEWGVTAQAGISTVGKGLSNVFKNGLFEKTESLDYMQYATPSTPNNNFLGSQGNYVAAAPPPASAVKVGKAWNVGAFGKWHVKERLALTFGAEYNLYTTNREVGNIVDQQYNPVTNSNVSPDANARFAAYYTGTDGVNYTNRYHFVQVPVGIQWQLNRGVTLPPIQFDAGLTFAYLVNTNAVHYRGGVYYEDKSLFNKFQTGLYTGFSVKLFQHTQRPLYVGPVAQYNLSGLGKPSSGLKQNFVYAGLKMQLVLFKQ